MALDANINRIKFLRTKTAGSIPSASLLDEGELAINLVDRTIYSKNGSNVVELGFGKGGSVSGAITAPQFNGPLVGNSSTATKLQTARTISLTGSATGSISFDGSSDQSISVDVNKLDNLATYTKSNSDSPTKWGQGIQSCFVSSSQGWPLPYGGVITARPHSNGGGTLQILTAYGSDSGVGGGEIKIRTGNYSVSGNDGWTSWKTLIHSENVNDYSPTKTGTGASGTWGISVSGNAATATTLQTARSFSWTGDATGSLSFNGSANVSAALTLANSGVSAGTYKSVTVDTKGRVTAGTNVITGLVTSTSSSGTTNAATSNTNTYLNIVETIGSSATTVGTSTQVTGAGTVTVTSDTAGKLTITGSQNITGNAATATALQTARSINGVLFNGTSDINIQHVAIRIPGNSNLNNYQTPGIYYCDTDAETTSTANTPINFSYSLVVTRTAGIVQTFIAYNGGNNDVYVRGFYSTAWTPWKKLAFTNDNVSTATALQTARTINGTSFNGTANITTANWGTARTLTIGNTGKSVNGSANVTWSLAEIGALPLAGGTTTGVVSAPAFGVNNSSATSGAGISLYNGSVSSQPSYGLMFAGTSTFGSHGSVTSDWATYFTMTGDTNRGWIFKHGTGTAGNVASISSAGVITASSFVGSLTGNASTASSAAQLTTARTIGGVSFNGTANINLPGVNIAGNQSTTGNAATATRLQTARTINGVSFDGTANITIADGTKLPLTGGTLSGALGVGTIQSASALSILAGGNAQKIMTGGVLASYSYADVGNVPDGGIWARGNITTLGNITASGNVTAYSDKKLKENILPISDALNKVNSLNGVTYTRNDLEDKTLRHVGLIAQDVLESIPEAVRKDNDTLMVDYMGLIGVLVESIKELKTEIDELKEKVK